MSHWGRSVSVFLKSWVQPWFIDSDLVQYGFIIYL